MGAVLDASGATACRSGLSQAVVVRVVIAKANTSVIASRLISTSAVNCEDRCKLRASYAGTSPACALGGLSSISHCSVNAARPMAISAPQAKL